MILYNSNYEFIGISDSCVKKLNFPSFNALKYRMGGDFANILIEKKGFVSNFKYISWIDYIQQENDKAKGIIKSGDGTYYKVTFAIEPYFFAQHSEKGYLITLSSMGEYDADDLDILDRASSFGGGETPLYVDEEEEYYTSGDNLVQESDTFVFDTYENEFSFDDEDQSEENKEREKDDEEEDKTLNYVDDEEGMLPPLEDDEFQFVESKNQNIEKIEREEFSLPPLDDIDDFKFEDEKIVETTSKKESFLDEETSLPPLDMGDFSFDDKKDEIEKSEEREENIDLSKNSELISPNDFLSKFEESVIDEKESIQPSFQEEKQENINQCSIEEYLNQNEIDSIINGESAEKVQHQDLPKFSSTNYPLDRVAEALEIDENTLSDFIIDFIHHINHVKSFIYEAIERDDVQSVKGVVFMVKGLCFNLRAMDIYNLLEKVERRNYNGTAELLKDINTVYQKVALLSEKIVHDGDTFKFQDVNLRKHIIDLNRSSLPDLLFQDIIDSFVKLFDSSKERVEESINPETIDNIKAVIKEMLNVALSLNIEELIKPLKSIYTNIYSQDIEFDRVVMDWIELSSYVDRLR